jgi:mannose-6-phosphate isomerase-like protein (cupin superfamily)
MVRRWAMRAKKKDIPVAFEEGKSSSRDVEWGEMNVAWETWEAGMDATPMFKGLPDDRCQCPHWGYMLKGRMRIKYRDHDEVINEGEVYYLPPGHIPVVEKDSEVVEFSPKGEYQKTMEVAARNMAALQKKG